MSADSTAYGVTPGTHARVNDLCTEHGSVELADRSYRVRTLAASRAKVEALILQRNAAVAALEEWVASDDAIREAVLSGEIDELSPGPDSLSVRRRHAIEQARAALALARGEQGGGDV